METSAGIQDFCRRYFQAVGAPILVDQPDFLQVELPREIDKELTDRPYFWIFVEATGQEVPNTVLSLSFAPELEIEGVERMEFVTLGSFRLNKVIDSAQKRGRITRVYQTSDLQAGTLLHPLLLTTFKLSFVADRRRDTMMSYAVHLGTGQVIANFYEVADPLSFASVPPSLVQAAPQMFSVAEGYERIRERLTEEIALLDHSWAEEAEFHLEEERDQLQTYYQSLGLVNDDEKKSDEEKAKKAALLQEEFNLRLQELEWRCAPRIQIVPLHFGLLYCTDAVCKMAALTEKRLSM